MVEIFKDKAGEWRFRIKGHNGEIVCQSEGYKRQADASNGVMALARILSDPDLKYTVNGVVK